MTDFPNFKAYLQWITLSFDLSKSIWTAIGNGIKTGNNNLWPLFGACRTIQFYVGLDTTIKAGSIRNVRGEIEQRNMTIHLSNGANDAPLWSLMAGH